jgi:hypothetical protein
MIILFNLKCTPHRMTPYNRVGLPMDDRLEVFKYSIASHAILDKLVSKYLFYVTLEKEWEHRKDDLENYIYQTINNDKLEIVWKRNETVEEWQQVCHYMDTIDDKTIWFAGNDDHIFMDYDLTCVYHGMKALEEDANPHAAMFYSHWFETIRVANRNKATLHPSGHVVSFPWAIHDSIRLVRKELWKHYWFSWDFRPHNGHLGRVDMIKNWTGDGIMTNCYIPTRELCRHYDGHSHVGDLFNHGPPIQIPEGFFEKKMKIRYGWNDGYKEGYVNVNPMGANLKTKDKVNGFDYKFSLDRLPLFWYGHIEQVVPAHGIDETAMKRAYENHFIESTKIPMNTYLMGFSPEDHPPLNWFNKHLEFFKG